MMTVKLNKLNITILIVVFTALGAVAYKQSFQKNQANQPNQVNKPVLKPSQMAADKKNGSKPEEAVRVTTVVAESRTLPYLIQSTGTLVSLNSVDVRAQMNSVIKKIHFKEGEFVKKGQLLFTLDARLDEANLLKAQAQVAKSKSAVADLKRQLLRNQQLFAQNFISSSVVEASQAALNGQLSSLAADEASLKAAAVPLSYANIVAPSSGRAGAVPVFVGSFVQSGMTPLVTITQLDPIAVSFNVPQIDLPKLLKAFKTNAPVRVESIAANNTIKHYDGQLQFIDSNIDVNSGTVKAKALIRNSSAELWPGSFVQVQVPIQTLQSTDGIVSVVIPQASIIQSARGAIVYVVSNGKAILKPIELLNASQGLAAVTGVLPGEAVVLDGRQNLRPNVTVTVSNLIKLDTLK